MAEAHPYLLCTDLLFGKECRMCVAERVKTEIRGEIQPLFEIGEDMRHRRQRHRLGLVFERAEDVVGFREPDSSPYFMIDKKAANPMYMERRFCCLLDE